MTIVNFLYPEGLMAILPAELDSTIVSLIEEGTEDDEIATNMRLEDENEAAHINRLFDDLDVAIAEGDGDLRDGIIDRLLIELYFADILSKDELLATHPRPQDINQTYFS